MNKPHTIFHLEEALEQLTSTIADLKKKRGYSDVELELDMEHLYHHMNTAWNGRNATASRVKKSTMRDFRAWRKFPKDLFREQ